MSPTEIKEETKTVVKNIISEVQKKGFWCVLLIALGFYLGVTYINKDIDKTTKKSIKLGGFIVKNDKGEDEVYDVIKRVMQQK